MSHQIIKRGSKDFYCTVCIQQWTIKSKAHCPGMKVIAWAKRGTFMSQTELGQRGYKNAPEDLPEPTCCYRSSGYNHAVVYTYLYDSDQCVRKKETGRPRLIKYIETLHWPKAWLPFLEDLSEWAYAHDHRNPNHAREWQRWCLEIGRMASAIHCFTEDELMQLGENYVVLTFSLAAIRAHWTDRRTSMDQVDALTEQLLRAYRKQRQPKPLSDLAIEVNGRIRQAKDNREKAIRERGVQVFPSWIVPALESVGPAKQLSLF
jgi:hypothetical protein